MPDEELDEPVEPDEELDEPDDEPDEPSDDVPSEPPLEDDLFAVPDELVPPEAAVELWVESGSVAATAPAPSRPATPTPAVTADSRFMPRRLTVDGGTGRPRGLLGIGDSFPLWLGRRHPEAAGRLVR